MSSRAPRFEALLALPLAAMLLLAGPARAVTLCDVSAPLRLAALDTREGIYVGEWRDEKLRVRSCMALAIERFNINETAVAVYFFGPEPFFNVGAPGFKREKFQVRGFDTLILQSLTDKYEFTLGSSEIDATYTSPSGVVLKGKLLKRY